MSKSSRVSAGLLMYRRVSGKVEVLLVHPGGPFFVNKDNGAWTIPKGEPGSEEDLLAAACREFVEETGICPAGPFLKLTAVKQSGGKTVHAWAVAGDCDPAQVTSNTFTLEWPAKSGKLREFPEVDRAEWFDLPTARLKINAAQVALIVELAAVSMDQGNKATLFG